MQLDYRSIYDLATSTRERVLLQNRDAFAWFQPFLDAKEAALHTAGSLRHGSRIWVLAKLNRRPLLVAPGDEVEKFILLSHGHDGSLAIRVGFTPIRVVCQNTLSMAHGCDASKLIRIKHTKDVHECRRHERHNGRVTPNLPLEAIPAEVRFKMPPQEYLDRQFNYWKTRKPR